MSFVRLRFIISAFLITVAACGSGSGSGDDDSGPDGGDACIEDTTQCTGNSFQHCVDGSGGSVLEDCTGGQHCAGGECVDLCAEADETDSYIGCEYYAVDLDNAVEVLDPVLFGCVLDYGFPGRTDLEVCWDGSASAGLCDPGNTCPGGYTCQLPTSEVCVLDAPHSPFAVVVSNPQVVAVNVTISNQAGTTYSETVQPEAVTAIFPQSRGFADQTPT